MSVLLDLQCMRMHYRIFAFIVSIEAPVCTCTNVYYIYTYMYTQEPRYLGKNAIMNKCMYNIHVGMYELSVVICPSELSCSCL